MAARFDGSIDAGRCRLNEEGSSEIAFGIDTSGADRPAWPQVCRHGTDSADVVLNGAVVGDVDTAARVADGRLKAKPESLGLADGGGHRPEEKNAGRNRNGNGADNRGPVGNCIQHDHPVRLGECRPAVALVACIRECRCRRPAWRHHVRLASCSGSIIVGCQVVPALSLCTVYASHSGNDAYGPQVDHALCEQPALRQQQTLAYSGGFPRMLPRQKAGIALTVVAPNIANQPVVARFSYGCRLSQ